MGMMYVQESYVLVDFVPDEFFGVAIAEDVRRYYEGCLRY